MIPVRSIFGCSVVANHKVEIPSKVIVIIGGVIVSGIIAYDISWHSSYVYRTENIYGSLTKIININSVESLYELEGFTTKAMQSEIIFLERSLHHSYGSWLAPWSWNSSQANAYNKIQIASHLLVYLDLFAKGNDLKGKDVTRHARKLFAPFSMYPCVECYRHLQKHIGLKGSSLNLGKEMSNLFNEASARMQHLAELLLMESGYIQDLQAIQMHNLQRNNN